MHKNYINFRRKVYEYCDEKIDEKVLFPAFVNLWDEDEGCIIIKKDLVGVVEKVIKGLIKINVLEEIEKPKKLESSYGYYLIKSHKNLISDCVYIRRKFDILNKCST